MTVDIKGDTSFKARRDLEHTDSQMKSILIARSVLSATNGVIIF